MTPLKWAPWLGCAVLGLILAGQCSVEPALRAKLAANQDSLKVAQRQRYGLLKALAVSAANVKTVYDTRWLPAKAKVESLPVGVPVPYPVYVNTVHDADTTINACRRALHDCGAVVAADSAAIRAQQRRIDLLEHRREPFRPWVYGATDLRGHLYLGATAQGRVPLLPVVGYARAETRLDSLSVDLRVGAAVPF